jgi:hypothetical protein
MTKFVDDMLGKYGLQKGDTFGHLVFTGVTKRLKENYGDWNRNKCEVECMNCGTITYVRMDMFAKGLLKSCGCKNNAKDYPNLLLQYGDDYTYYILWKYFQRPERPHLEYTITVDDIKARLLQQNHKCFYTGTSFSLPRIFKDMQKSNAPSLDRIDSNLGYIPGNIDFVTKQIQLMKHILSKEDFINNCCLVSTRFCA